MKKRLRRVLVRHTPWARSSDMMLRPWLSCSCGWNANRRELGNWNDHFMAAAAKAGARKNGRVHKRVARYEDRPVFMESITKGAAG